ncbi:hypothetical protein BJX61DRAFT_122967 [Aspergillus egyptiacus]|nr:hypothetical protein BJX61DRAFT_122967 [Aspergillus egyptiacus]
MKRTIDCSHTLTVEIQMNSRDRALQHRAVWSFATGEKINGVISIAARSDIAFDNLHISFIGEQSTRIPSDNPDKALHRFLEVKHPSEAAILPSPRVLKAGHHYEFPFSFEVPDYLPSSCCPHSAHPLVKAAHLQPPPSCGDASLSGFGGRLRDDSVPPACKVVYAILVQLQRAGLVSGIQETILEKRFKVRIKPLAGEILPPDLPMGSLDNDYTLYQEEPIRNSKSNHHLSPVGSLAITLEQPDCFWLPLRDPISPISKAVRFSLLYTSPSPSNQSSTSPSPPKPPDLKSLRAAITATTLYTTSLTTPEPIPPKRKDFLNRPLNFSDIDIPLSIPSTPHLTWTQVESETGTATVIVQTASLLVPVTLPRDKTFPPTFHSCLISRVYSLTFQIAFQGVSVPFRLRVPMRIAAERDPGILPSYRASLGVVEADWGGE